jgi:hypothetical protein
LSGNGVANTVTLSSPAGLPSVPDSFLDDLAADTVCWRGTQQAGQIDVPALALAVAGDRIPTDSKPEHERPEETGGFLARLAVTLLSVG